MSNTRIHSRNPRPTGLATGRIARAVLLLSYLDGQLWNRAGKASVSSGLTCVLGRANRAGGNDLAIADQPDSFVAAAEGVLSSASAGHRQRTDAMARETWTQKVAYVCRSLGRDQAAATSEAREASQKARAIDDTLIKAGQDKVNPICRPTSGALR